jgi:hypothetical protein
MSMSTRSTRAKREALEEANTPFCLLVDLLAACPDLFEVGLKVESSDLVESSPVDLESAWFQPLNL